MKYTIAKLPVKSVKSNTRYSYDSRRHHYDCNNETGCTKLNQFIHCLHDIVSNKNNWIEIIYDAPTDILNISVERNCTTLYKLEFHLIIVDDKISYNIKVDKIDWTKVVKEAKLFNPNIAAQGDILIVENTNHAELKLVVSAVKRHYTKYNLCKHYEETVTPALEAVDQEIDDAGLIDMIDKHAKNITLKRIEAFGKKYSIKAKAEIICDTFNMHHGKKTLYVCKLSDGNFIANVEVRASYNPNDYRRACPYFYMTYYINNKTGKITWLYRDDKFCNSLWYFNQVSCEDDKVKLRIEIEQIGDWNLENHAKSYDEWFSKFGFAEYVETKISKLMERIKAERGL